MHYILSDGVHSAQTGQARVGNGFSYENRPKSSTGRSQLLSGSVWLYPVILFGRSAFDLVMCARGDFGLFSDSCIPRLTA